MDAKADLFYNTKTDVYGDTFNLLVLDDEAEVNRMLCMTIADTYPELIVLSCVHPARALSLMNELYFDILITDINMPALRGDAVIEQVRRRSPTTYIMAMTGHTMESAFIAGKAKPDFFLDKNKGFAPLIDDINKGIQASLSRQIKVLSAVNQKSDPEEASQHLHWRERKKLFNALGFKPREISQSRELVKAIAILSGLKEMTKEEIAFCTGFSSYQRLLNQLNVLSGFITLPSLP